MLEVPLSTVYRALEIKGAARPRPKPDRHLLLAAGLTYLAWSKELPRSNDWNVALARELPHDRRVLAHMRWSRPEQPKEFLPWPDYRDVNAVFGSWPAFHQALQHEYARLVALGTPFVAVPEHPAERMTAMLRSTGTKTPTRGPATDRLFVRAVKRVLFEARRATAADSPRTGDGATSD